MNKSPLPLLATGIAALLLIGGAWILRGPAPAQAAPAATTWYVDAAVGDDANDCLSPATACATIGMAVTKASDGDSIEIAAGTYAEYGLEISKDLSISGAGADTTVVDGGGNGRVLETDADISISGLRIQNGQTSDSGDLFATSGAGIKNSGNLTLTEVVVSDNNAGHSGGGIFNTGNLYLTGTQILSNTATNMGGGINNYAYGNITITRSTLAYNAAQGSGGGALYILGFSGVRIAIRESTLSDNTTGYYGGGIYSTSNITVTLEAVTLTGNEAAAGAAFTAQSAGAITMTNVTVSGNNALDNFGGIYILGADVHLAIQNSTIAYNTRSTATGNGYNGLSVGSNAVVTLKNTILAHNQGKNCKSGSGGTLTSLGYNLSSDYSCPFDQSGDAKGTDPLLMPLGDYGGFVATRALTPGSPAVDAGDSAACPANDARGIVRPYDGDGDGNAVCDIGAVEARRQVSIADTAVEEGDGVTVSAVFTVTLAPTSTTAIQVDYTTADGSALAGSDYTAISGTLTFNPGEAEKYISVDVTGDTDDEPDETFSVRLSSADAVDLLDAEATGTIVDNDGLPALSIGDQSILEGSAGSSAMQFLVTLSPSAASTVTVDYATADGSARAGNDYTSASGTLTFNPGQTEKYISVDVTGDVVDEGAGETFSVHLSNAANAAITDADAAGTITDDDEARLRMEAGPQVLEGDSGYTSAVFTVTLSTPAAFTVTADYATKSGYGDTGAQAGEDFVPISGTLHIAPGETRANVTVQVIGDTEMEEDERCLLILSNPSVPYTTSGAYGYILNDDQYRIFLPLLQR